ncbi:hypothetical protein J057_18255 [Marinobacter nanhaiticus D15-8W]|uniref:Uncharacterized protein n=1 Tax=Marinobacter nanhaiticus D15-8W TaxID=626887 RepID=N6VT80_9GAMM|nr:hypothetical protein [Marinobacter nanhaiticus]ENO13365.1 hypothetical protein J057_18255 [Marinobacter nanhaiticus D15-8W]
MQTAILKKNVALKSPVFENAVLEKSASDKEVLMKEGLKRKKRSQVELRIDGAANCLILQTAGLAHIPVKTLHSKHGRPGTGSNTGGHNVVICTPMAVNFGKEFACRTGSLLCSNHINALCNA